MRHSASLSEISYLSHSLFYRWGHFDGLVQERHNSIANALELHLSCTNPYISACSIWYPWVHPAYTLSYLVIISLSSKVMLQDWYFTISYPYTLHIFTLEAWGSNELFISFLRKHMCNLYPGELLTYRQVNSLQIEKGECEKTRFVMFNFAHVPRFKTIIVVIIVPVNTYMNLFYLSQHKMCGLPMAVENFPNADNFLWAILDQILFRKPFVADKVYIMMKFSNGNIIHVTGPLCMEFTGHWWIPRTKASDVELEVFIYAWINGWVNNREAGDLRCYRAHYDIIVMFIYMISTVVANFGFHISVWLALKELQNSFGNETCDFFTLLFYEVSCSQSAIYMWK